MGDTFMVGMINTFDEKRFNLEFKEGFWGVEAGMLETIQDIDKLRDEANNKGFNYGLHYPLRMGISVIRDPLFLSLDDAIRKDAYKQIEDELSFIKKCKLKPVYILFHYPKPVILSDDFDLTNWRFVDKREYMLEKDYPKEKLISLSEALFKWLTEKAIEYSFIPILELDGIGKYFWNDNFLEALLDKYPRIKICLDTSRLHFQHMVQKEFDEISIIKRFAKYTYLLHLSTVKVNDSVGISHHPVLQEHLEEDGWAPIKKYLELLKKLNPNIKIYYEHRSYLISNEQLKNSYSWIEGIWNEK